MQNSWIIDVLSDVTRFAEENALPETHEALKMAILVAKGEVAYGEQSENAVACSGYDRATTTH